MGKKNLMPELAQPVNRTIIGQPEPLDGGDAEELILASKGGRGFGKAVAKAVGKVAEAAGSYYANRGRGR
jgi:hypothetical protein